jgi:hypothetical protein
MQMKSYSRHGTWTSNVNITSQVPLETYRIRISEMEPRRMCFSNLSGDFDVVYKLRSSDSESDPPSPYIKAID